MDSGRRAPAVDGTYRLLCDLLAGRAEQSDWTRLTDGAWDIVVRTAEAEGVAPLVYWHLNELGWTALLPPVVRAALSGSYYDSIARTSLTFHELARILHALDTAGVPVVVLKGAVLATTCYPDPALRPMGDLDLLVHREDAAAAVDLVRSLGYTAIEFFRGFSLEFGHHTHLVSSERHGLPVEVHWNLIASQADRVAPREDWSWQHAIEWSAAPRLESTGTICRALALADEAHFLYLAAHLVLQHPASQERLIWWYDLYLLLRGCGSVLDWDCVVMYARDVGWVRGLEEVAHGLAQRFGSSMPAGLLGALIVSREFDADLDRLGQARESRGRKRGALGVFHALDWRARFRLLRGLALPSRAFLLWYYRPKLTWLWFAYYPRRWFEVITNALAVSLNEEHR